MGFFSWMTQDTNSSIPSSYSSHVPVTVYMFDDKGNKWEEDDYEGYGVFGGKDYFDLMAEMNGLQGREAGIDLLYNREGKTFIAPNLAEDENWVWKNEVPEDCPNQGFFYYDDDDDDDEEDFPH